MEISSFSTPPSAPTPSSAPAGSRTRATNAAGSPATAALGRSANLGAYQAVQQAMNNLPDTRADVVARGKELAASPIWPAAEIINKLAEMFIADAESAMAD